MASPARARRIVGVSTKMYFTRQQTDDYVDSVLKSLPSISEALESVDVFVIPDFVTLSAAADKLHGSPVLLGAQDCMYEDYGAFTGEVSPAVLKDVGCRIVELGHAERRKLFGETDEITAKKAAAAVRNGLIPLVCIGEVTKGEVSIAVDECSVQVRSVLDFIPETAEIIFAYEPVWAIGAKEPAGADHVIAVAQGIRKLLDGRKGMSRILYGGSAGMGLFRKLNEGVDGLFLGRFAHDPAQFAEIIKEVAAA